MGRVLEIHNLECAYLNSAAAVSAVSLTLDQGHIVTVLGPNGAGKTTLLRCIMGETLLASYRGQIRKGSIYYDGNRVDVMPTPRVVRLGISLVAEGRGIFGDMTVEDNLKVGGHCLPHRDDLFTAYDKVYSLFPQLRDRRKQLAGYLSGGEQQMLAIARALMTTPGVMLVDEPSLGLSPRMVDEIARLIVDVIKPAGVSVLLVEQNVSMALELADYAYIMEGGSIVADGMAAQFRHNTHVKAFYLGARRGFRTSAADKKPKQLPS